MKKVGKMAVVAGAKEVVTLRESEIRDFLARYPGLRRADVLHAIVKAGPSREAVDRAIGRLWADLVLRASQRSQ
jgi:hypothetical protein